MFNQDELTQVKRQYDAFRAGQRPVQQTASPAPKKKGNFLTSLLPSGGGLAGAAGGAAIGTAVLPGIGTLAGALLGGALGGGAGKVAENKIEGQSLSKGVAGEAALNGVLGAGPLRLAKVGVDAVRGVRAGTDIASALANAGTKAVDMSATKAVGDKLQKSGQGLIAKEFRLNPTQQADFKNVHGEEAVSVLRRYGIKRPEDLAAKIAPLQNAFDGVVNKVPAVSQKQLSDGLKSVYEPLLKSPNILVERPLGQQIKAQADELVKLAENGDIPASKVNELRKSFDAAVRYTQKGSPEFSAVKETADALRTTLQGAAEKAGVKSANGQSFKDVGLELSKLHELNDIVGKQSYLGTGSLPVSIGNLPGVTAGGAAGGLPGAVVGFGANAVLNSPVGRRALANGFLKGGEKLSARAAGANPYGIGKVASRVAPVGLAGALIGNMGQSDANNTPMTAMTTNATTMPSNTNMPELSQIDTNMSTPNNPLAPENLRASIEQILANGGSLKDAQEFVSLADALQKIQPSGQSKTKLNATQIQQANNAQSGLDSLATIQQTLTSNPNAAKLASLPGGSFTQSLTGTGSYTAAIANATDVIGRLRSGGAINAEEEKRFRSLLPSAFNDPETINYKLGQLSNLFQRFVNPQSAQPDTADLSSALSAGGY